MIHLLAQTGATVVYAQEPEWHFWVTICVGVGTLLCTILLPFVLSGISGIRHRLDRGDSKFDEQGKAIAVLANETGGLKAAMNNQATGLDRLLEKITNVIVEGQGHTDDVARQVERDFVRKTDLRALEERMDSRFEEMARAIQGLRK